jgi:Phosphotransferase enzyme family
VIGICFTLVVRELRVDRVGGFVHRPLHSWSPAVHDLLRYLASVDFPAPRVIDVVGDHEVLTWIEGESGAEGWAKIVSERGLRRWAGFLREFHDAVAGYHPPAESAWSSGIGTCAPGELICHGDFGPWNAVWHGWDVVGLIDWDHARPAPPIFDVAYGLEYAVPFRSDEECVQWLRYPEGPDRRHRIEVFCSAYGIDAPVDVRACVAAQQQLVMQTCEELGLQGIEPQATWLEEGYLSELQSRIAWTRFAAL